MLGSSPERGIFLIFVQWKLSSWTFEYAEAYHVDNGSTIGGPVGPKGDSECRLEDEVVEGVSPNGSDGARRWVGGVEGCRDAWRGKWAEGALSLLAAGEVRVRSEGEEGSSLSDSEGISSTLTTSSV